MAPTDPRSIVTTDLELARKLERAEARACAGFVEARARHSPGCGAQWIELGGTYAMYDEPSSPVTQSFGLGMFEPVTKALLERLEDFFLSRGAPADHEICPMSGTALSALLCERRYVPIEFANVLYLPLQEWKFSEAPDNGDVSARIAGLVDRELWVKTTAEGWRESVEFTELLMDLMRIAAAREEGVLFLAEKNGAAIAGAALCIEGPVALLAGSSTIPEARRQGAQRALLHSRLSYAAEAGCELAMIAAEPGSASQRNAERAGFRIAYTRTKWRLTR